MLEDEDSAATVLELQATALYADRVLATEIASSNCAAVPHCVNIAWRRKSLLKDERFVSRSARGDRRKRQCETTLSIRQRSEPGHEEKSAQVYPRGFAASLRLETLPDASSVYPRLALFDHPVYASWS